MPASNGVSPRSNGIVRFASPFSFAETVQRVLDTLSGHGIKVFATWDQRAEAAAVGLSMPPATLIVFGNPKAGTPLMLAQPESALDLPLKLLVLESGGQVSVCFNTPDYLIRRHALPEPLSANLAPAFALIERALQA
ncbi:MAG TPA: DUF302 domain-containing protein [Rhodanobacteraceae bacterium]|jgi:uncharacterized protein (DUF302 family)|nr:DUF302 domain-containing protein [Rhodanobacteraceae bacterium]